jgi:hypothetical protein
MGRSQGPTVEFHELDEAKPDQLKDSPAVVFPFPVECRGRSSAKTSLQLLTAS